MARKTADDTGSDVLAERSVSRGTRRIKQPVIGAPPADLSSDMSYIGMGTQKGGFYMYYRKPDGWIILADADENQVKDNVARGLEPLPKYGLVFLHPPRKLGLNIVSGWHESYRVLLDHPDGPGEFSLAQIVEMGWHRKLPYPEISFPQLQGYTVQDHRCDFCGRVFDERRYLDKHVMVMHRDNAAMLQQRELLGQVRDVLTAQGEGPGTKELLQALIEMMGKVTVKQST